MPIIASSHITASGQVSGSLDTTGSFGHLIVSGDNFDTAVSSSAASAGFGSGGSGGSGTITALNNQSANRLVTIGSTTTELDGEANLTFDGSDLTVNGDIILDDGGSLKEAGGTAAITFDGSGNVTKIGQDSPNDDEVLTWDGSKWVAAAVASSGGGTGLVSLGNTVHGVLAKTNTGLTASFSETVLVKSGSLFINSQSLNVNHITSNKINITSASFLHSNRDFGPKSQNGNFGHKGGTLLYDQIGLHFSPDGKYYYIMNGGGNEDIYQWKLNKPFDAFTGISGSGIYQVGRFDLNTTFDNPGGFYITPAGDKLIYTSHDSSGTIVEYRLQTPHNIYGAPTHPFKYQTISSEETTPEGIVFRPDGLKMYIAGNSSNSILQYSLSSSFDIGTISFEKKLDISHLDTDPQDVRFDNTGTQLFFLGKSSDRLYGFELSSSWDIGSVYNVSSSQQLYLNDSNMSLSSPTSFFFKPDQTELYIIGEDEESTMYALSLTGSLTSSEQYNKTDIFGRVNFEGGDVNYNYTSKIKISGSLDVNPNSDINFNTQLKVASSSIQTIGLSHPYDLDRMTHKFDTYRRVFGSFYNHPGGLDQKSGFGGYVGSSNNKPTLLNIYYPVGISFSPAGDKMVIMDGLSNEELYGFTLKKPWDLKTMNYTERYDISTNYDNIYGFWMHPDGFRFWTQTIETGKLGMTEWKTTKSWDISNTVATPVKQVTFASLDNRTPHSDLPTGGSERGLWWKNDGTKFYTLSLTNDINGVMQFGTSGSAFDGGAGYLEAVHPIGEPDLYTEADGDFTSLAFTHDGSQMTVVVDERLYLFDLSINWEIKTAVVRNHIDLGIAPVSTKIMELSGSTYYNDIGAMFFKPDNKTLYAVDTNQDRIAQFEFVRNGNGNDLHQISGSYNPTFISGSSENLVVTQNTDFYSNVDLFGELTLRQGNQLKSPHASVRFNTGIDVSSGSLFTNGIGKKLELHSLKHEYNSDDIVSGSQQFKYNKGYGGVTQWYDLVDFAFSPDGKSLMILNGFGNEEMIHYSLKRPFDIRTQMLHQRKDFSSGEDLLYGMWWHPTGTRFWLNSNDTTVLGLAEYRTSTPWDLTDVTQHKKINVPALDTRNTDLSTVTYSNLRGIRWKPDGTRFYMSGLDSGVPYGDIYEFHTTGSIFDAGAGVLVNILHPNLGLTANVHLGFEFSGDGSQLFVGYGGGQNIFQFELMSPWDISSAKPKNQVWIGEGNGNNTDPYAIQISPDGKGLYILSEDKFRIGKYSFHQSSSNYSSTPDDIADLNNIDIGGSVKVHGDLDVTGQLIFGQPTFKTEGSVIVNRGITSVTGSNDFSNISNRTDLQFAHYHQSSSNPNTITDIYSMYIKNDGRAVYLLGGPSNDYVYEYELYKPWDISTMEKNYHARSHDLGLQEEGAYGCTFSPDGRKFFICGTSDDGVNSYNLLRPWDVSTLEFEKTVTIANINAFSGSKVSETIPSGLEWKPDGTRLYIIGQSTNSVLEFHTTGSNFDIGSLQLRRKYFVTDVGETTFGETYYEFIRFSGDGTQMFIGGDTTDSVFLHYLRTPWDVSTARLDSHLKFWYKNAATTGTVHSDAKGFFLKPDGSSFYMANTADHVYQYSLVHNTSMSFADKNAGSGSSPVLYYDSTQSSSISTLDMSGQVNLFGSMNVSQDVHVVGNIDGNVRGHRPIIEQRADFSCGNLSSPSSSFGYYYRVTGSLTCSILADPHYSSSAYVPIGSEYDFFQITTGSFLFESASGVTVNSKNNNMNLAGQFSSATLKKVRPNEWDLLGDLT